MNSQNYEQEAEEHGDVFLDESDIIQEIPFDEEELPEADEEHASDEEHDEVAEDSMHIFTGHTDELYTVACSPTDPTLVATGGGDDKGFMWRIGRGDWAFELLGHGNSVTSVSFSADGQLLASGGYDGIIKIWDVSKEELKCTLEGPGNGIEWVKWHPRGHVVLAGSEDFSVWMWNADKKNGHPRVFSGHGNVVTCGDFTPDGKTICTGSDDATLRIWNPVSCTVIREIGVNNSSFIDLGYPYHTEGLTCMAISPDSAVALTGSTDHKVHMVNISSGKVVRSLTAHTDSIECVGFSPSGQWVATGSLDHKLIVWDLQHSEPRNTFLHEDGVTCLIWLTTSNPSRYIATGSADGKVRVWDGLAGGNTAVRTFSGHTEGVQSLSVSADGNFLVSAALDGTARVFEIHEFK
ncbi:Angio-associated migratory cell protein [Bienertia sinuspersici]